jgi:hypothetical protein
MSQAVGVDPELIAALTKRQLWTFHVPADSNAFQSIIPVIDGDPRVKRGEFAIGVRVKAVKEGVVIAGALESVVSTGPGAFRNLNDMPLPRDFEIRISEQGTLRPVEREVAERLWRYLLLNDLGLVAFVEPHLADDEPPDLTALFDDFGTQLFPWHRDAIERAVAVANVHDRDLTIELLFAGFLYDAEERRKASTLAHVARVLTEGRSPVDLLSVLGLRPAIQTLEVPQRALTVSRETYGVVIRLLSLANRMRASTEDTPEIRTRHVAAAFLVDGALTKYLQSLGFDVIRLRTAVFDFVIENVKVDPERWRAILGLSGKPQTPPSTFAIETIVSRDTWTTEDKLGYELYAQAITESILKGDTEPPLTIGIQAPWGQGKTSLMRMMQEKLDKGSSNRDQVAKKPATVQSAITTTYRQLIEWTKSGPRKEIDAGKGMLQCADGVVPTIWFNPLYYRETSQVWAGMAHAILHQLVDRFKDPADRELFWFRLQQARINTEAIRTDIHHRILQRFLPYGIALVVLTVLAIAIAAFPPIAALLGGAGITGGAYAIFKWITEQKEIDASFDKFVTEPNYRTELGLLHLIDHDLDRALGLLVGSSPIAVFIDDLDRCDPQTVNQVILAINQFLSLPRRNVFFFLGMDMEMVAAALEQAQKELGGSMGTSYRRSFGWRFMEKFVQLPFVIPHLEREHAQEFAEAYLRGQRAAAAAVPDPQQLVEKVASAATLDDLGAAAKLPADTPPEIKQQVQQAASTRAAELMQSNDSDEMKAIAKMAVQDLELNPRTIVRYFCLVRVLRNIQIAAGKSSDADTDRKLIIRAAHLLMNWPQFVQWLRNEPETLNQGGEWTPTVGEIATLASKSGTLEEWCAGVTKIARSDKAPAWLADASLYRYLRKLADGGPGLQAMYDARVF